jgi:hypothetical protein
VEIAYFVLSAGVNPAIYTYIVDPCIPRFVARLGVARAFATKIGGLPDWDMCQPAI